MAHWDKGNSNGEASEEGCAASSLEERGHRLNSIFANKCLNLASQS